MAEKNELVLDLSKVGKGCTETPIIRLTQALSKISSGERLKVIASKSEIPLKVIELLANKKGFNIKIIKEENEIYEVIYFK